MKRIRYGVYSVLLSLSLVASLVVPSGIASATSFYDDLLRTTNYLPLKTSASDPGVDVSASWYELIKGTSFSSCTSIVKDSLDSAMDTGEWGITLYTGDAGNLNGADAHTETYVLVYWTDGVDGYNQFAGTSPNDYVQNVPGATPHREALLYIRDDDTASTPIHVECTNNSYTIISSRPLGTPGLSWFNYDAQVYFSTFDTVYPAGYEGEAVPAEMPAAKYAGLGDSYSAAEGNPSFEYGTDIDGQNECHRSLRSAYPRLLQTRLELGATAFVACGGATLANILGGQWNEPSQLDVLGEETEKITLTAGGNDVGFSSYVLGCVVACGPGTLIYSAMMDGIGQPAFKANLIFTFEEILEAAPNADLYVADYPYLAAEDATACQGLDFSGAYDVQEALNAVIGAAVAEVALNSSRIFMVRTNYSGSPFEGEHLCNNGVSFFNGLVSWPNVEYSLHPNEDGQEAYADVFEEAMS